jgi:hypothetical protein
MSLKFGHGDASEFTENITSRNCPKKGQRCLRRSPIHHPKTLFMLRMPAKSMVGALLAPLLGQFL